MTGGQRTTARDSVVLVGGTPVPDGQQITMRPSWMARRPISYGVVSMIAVGALAVSPSGTSRSVPGPSEHNARVAEYLLVRGLAAREHNTRVSEHLLHQR